MIEEWKSIYNNNYSVSNTGLVKSNTRIIQSTTGLRTYKEKLLKPEITSDGHLRVVLCDRGVKKKVFVHRLVAEAFIPNPNNYPVINHKDENPSNNNVTNLEWCSVAYNNAYNNRHQRIGDAEGFNVKVYDKDGNYIEILASITEFGRKYNISTTTAWRRAKDQKIINGYYIVMEGEHHEEN